MRAPEGRRGCLERSLFRLLVAQWFIIGKVFCRGDLSLEQEFSLEQVKEVVPAVRLAPGVNGVKIVVRKLHTSSKLPCVS
jgi:hypothetical protein